MRHSLPIEYTEHGIKTRLTYPVMPVGENYMDPATQYCWALGKAGEALSKGDALETSGFQTLTNKISAAAAGSMVLDKVSAGTSFLSDTALEEFAALNGKQRSYAMIWITSGTGEGQRGIVTGMSASQMFVYWDNDSDNDGTLETALPSGTDFKLTLPWVVSPADGGATTADGVVGVAQTDVKKDEYFMMLCSGYGFVKISGDVLANRPLRVGATSGEADDTSTPSGLFYAAPFATALQDGDQSEDDVIMANINVPNPLKPMPIVPSGGTASFGPPGKGT